MQSTLVKATLKNLFSYFIFLSSIYIFCFRLLPSVSIQFSRQNFDLWQPSTQHDFSPTGASFGDQGKDVHVRCLLDASKSFPYEPSPTYPSPPTQPWLTVDTQEVFLGRFKGISITKKEESEGLVVSFKGYVHGLVHLKRQLFRFNYDQIFGAFESADVAQQQLSIDLFVDIFTGIDVSCNPGSTICEIVYTGSTEQLRFIRQQLYDYGYFPIFG